VGERIVFRDVCGRVLTERDLKGFSGPVRWAVIGGEAVSPEAARLHAKAREAGRCGDYFRALDLLDEAQALAPAWPYPVYDAAYTYLLLDEPLMAEELYRRVDQMAPRGFFACKTSLDTLRRERAGEVFPGFAKAYATIDWLDPVSKKSLLQSITSKFPAYAPAWKDLAPLLDDDADRLRAIERGLAGRPDPQTLGLLLVNKALILANNGARDEAISILGTLALSPDAPLAAEHHAKATLASLIFG
jgi:tetratricopeptide (TPR) repeat protein